MSTYKIQHGGKWKRVRLTDKTDDLHTRVKSVRLI